jgi:phasin family protein
MANTNSSNQHNKNAFFNPFEQWNNNQFWPDFGNMKQQINKNMETVTSANQAILDFTKEAGRRNTEITQKNTKCAVDCMQDAMSCKNIQDAQSKHQDMVVNIVQNTVSQVQEMAEIFAKATKEVLDIYNKRFQEVVVEVAKK